MEEINLNDTIDARIWTQKWLATIEKNPSIPTDEGTMLGWFANAIMAGYDHARREMENDITETSNTVPNRPQIWSFPIFVKRRSLRPRRTDFTAI